MEDKIISKLKILNEELNRKYFLLDSFTVFEKKKILKDFGSFKKIEPMEKEKLKKLKSTGGVYAVDGSTNRYGGAFPHYIQIFRGLAIKDIKDAKEAVEVYCPLVEDIDIYEENKTLDKLLADVELEAAIEAIEDNPSIIMMDGSLIRYRILNEKKWEKLKNIAIEKNIYIVGVIEDIKTNIVYENIKDDYNSDFFYDREFLFNCLEYKEAYIPNEKDSGKYSYKIRSSFIRSSFEPAVIAVDMVEEQFSKIEDVLSLVLSLTDKKSRGIPYILDIVDMKAKVTNKKMKYLSESYITKNRFELLFHSQRDKRSM